MDKPVINEKSFIARSYCDSICACVVNHFNLFTHFAAQAFGIADLARDVMGQARPGEQGLTEYPFPAAAADEVEVRTPPPPPAHCLGRKSVNYALLEFRPHALAR